MSNRYRFGLTMRDENVPDGYIGIYDIFSDKKYALPMCNKDEWCIGKEQLKKMRYDTYNAVRRRFDLCGSEDYAKFWNGNLDAINDLGLNRFAALPYFQEIATAMICFQTTETNPISKNKRKMISWGIKDSIYREYYKSQREAISTGKEPKKVNLFDQRKSRNGNLFKLPDAKFIFETESGAQQIIKVKKNALYNQFEFWCKTKGISKKDGIYQAMAFIMAEHPVDNLQELGAYERKCDLDYYEVVVPETTEEDTVSATVYIPKSIHKKMREIIERRNSDVEHIGEPKETVNAYIAQAVDLLNQKAPLRYSDPKAYNKYMKAKKAEAYNKRILEET